jgi:hypothetical protein
MEESPRAAYPGPSISALTRFFTSLAISSPEPSARKTSIPIHNSDKGTSTSEHSQGALKESPSSNRKTKGCPLPSPHPDLDLCGANRRHDLQLPSISKRSVEIFEMPADPYPPLSAKAYAHALGNQYTMQSTPASASSSFYSSTAEHRSPSPQGRRYCSTLFHSTVAPPEDPSSATVLVNSPQDASSFTSPESAYPSAFENPFEVAQVIDDDKSTWSRSHTSHYISDADINSAISPLTSLKGTSTGGGKSMEGDSYSPWLWNPVLNGTTASTASAMRIDPNSSIDDHIAAFQFLDGVTLYQVSELRATFPDLHRGQDALGIDWQPVFREMVNRDLDLNPGRREVLRLMVRIPGARIDTFLSKYDISKFIKLNHGMGYGCTCFTLQVTNRLGPDYQSLLEHWRSSTSNVDNSEDQFVKDISSNMNNSMKRDYEAKEVANTNGSVDVFETSSPPVDELLATTPSDCLTM